MQSTMRFTRNFFIFICEMRKIKWISICINQKSLLSLRYFLCCFSSQHCILDDVHFYVYWKYARECINRDTIVEEMFHQGIIPLVVHALMKTELRELKMNFQMQWSHLHYKSFFVAIHISKQMECSSHICEN